MPTLAPERPTEITWGPSVSLGLLDDASRHATMAASNMALTEWRCDSVVARTEQGAWPTPTAIMRVEADPRGADWRQDTITDADLKAKVAAIDTGLEQSWREVARELRTPAAIYTTIAGIGIAATAFFMNTVDKVGGLDLFTRLFQR